MRLYMDIAFARDRLTEELKNPESEFYFSKLNNVTVGYLKVNYGSAQTELQNPQALEIERIYVLKDYFGKKIGQVLLNKAIRIAQEKKLSYLWLGVWEKNFRAHRFYEKNGFVKFRSHQFKLGEDIQTDNLMKLELK